MGKHIADKNKKTKTDLLDRLKKQLSLSGDRSRRVSTESNIIRSRDKKFTFVLMFIAALLLLVLPLFGFDGWMLICAYGAAWLIAAFDLAIDVIEDVASKDYFSENIICLLASLACFCIGSFWEAVLIILVFRGCVFVAQKVESISWERLRAFSQTAPETVDVETAEGVLTVHPDYVRPGDIIVASPGSVIALDGVIVEGISTIDTSLVSGQSTAWAVTEGHRVYSGCKNLTSPLRIRVARPAEQSTIRSVIKLAESSSEYLSRQEKLSRTLTRFYLPAALALAVTLGIVLSVQNGNWTDSVSRSVILLVAALSVKSLLSVRFSYIRSIGKATGSGVFFKGSDCIEALAKAETMVFDKTGIITEGRYTITEVFPNGVSERQLLSMASTAERFSRHPIAAALRDAAGPIDIDYKALQIEEIPGKGVSAFVGGQQVYVGNASLLEEHGIRCVVPTRSGSAVHVAVDQKYWGHIIVTDRIRRGAFDALENLRAHGVRKTVLLTGDVLSVAKPLASKLNFDMLRAELKPSEKTSAVDFLMSNRGESTSLAFVGDGNSDEQIMSRVDVGISLGALGSDAALASADILIMDRDIKKLPATLALARLSYRIAMENLLFTVLANLLLIFLGAFGMIPVWAAVLIQFIVVILTMLNTSRI